MPKERKVLENISRITAYSCAFDPRFSYYVYVPRNWFKCTRPRQYRLIVLIHGSERSPERYRNCFSQLAEQTNSVILAPLFPAGPINQGEIENYNFLKFGDILFNVVLVHMIDELNSRFPIDMNAIIMHGFSAGGQFVHRFMYLYPERLSCVSIGSPGNVTFFDADQDWPFGTRDLLKQFGRSPDIEALRRIPVQIVVGEADTRIDDPATPLNRVELNKTLFQNYKKEGMNVRFDLIPGVGHDGMKVVAAVSGFILENMELSQVRREN